MRVDLPGGQWAEIRDPLMVKESQRRPLMRAMGKVKEDDEAIDSMGTVHDALLLALVESWSLPEPVTAETIGELTIGVYDALRAQCMPLMPQIIPDFGPTPDPQSPTPPSAA